MSAIARKPTPPAPRRRYPFAGVALLWAVPLALMFGRSCSMPNVPPQPDAGFAQDYRMQVVRSLPVQLDGQLSSPTARLNLYADGVVALSGLPWYHQGSDRTCAQANIAMLMGYWGKPTSYQQVVREMNPGNLPTDVVNVTGYLRQKGLSAQDYRLATLNFVKERINAGRPVLVLLDFGSLASTHYVTIKGYDDRRKELLVSDPVIGANVRLPYEAFDKYWQNRSLSTLPGFKDKYARIAFDVGPAKP